MLSRFGRPPRRGERIDVDGFAVTGFAAALTALASRADALLHVVLVKPNVAPSAEAARDIALLADAAARTGGALYPPTPKDAELVPSFERAIEAFRGSYVLYFSPTGVTRTGWHALTVDLVKPGNFQLRARQGYYGG